MNHGKRVFAGRVSGLTLGVFATIAFAESASKTWRFDLPLPGTYKIQVEHSYPAPAPSNVAVTYAIQIGERNVSRSIDLIANQPFIPLITDTPDPSRLRVTISGLAADALLKTKVRVYDSMFASPDQYEDAIRAIDFPEAGRARRLLAEAPEAMDLGRVKLSIDKLVDPRIDIEAGLRSLDAIAKTIKGMPEYGPSPTSRAIALRKYLYEAGSWNEQRAYSYDFDDPLGTKLSNKLLTNYLMSRKGNCVTMPFLFIILGQRLGIDVTAATAPLHFLVKFKDEAGRWINLEATSGANPSRDVWYREQMPMTDIAIANGIYLQALSKTETAAEMAVVLAEHYFDVGEYGKAKAIADIVLQHVPKDVGTMTLRGTADFRQLRELYLKKYGNEARIPAESRAHYSFLGRGNRYWFSKAERLGWREPPPEDKDQYMRRVNDAKRSAPLN